MYGVGCLVAGVGRRVMVGRLVCGVGLRVMVGRLVVGGLVYGVGFFVIIVGRFV